MEIADIELWADVGLRDVWTKIRANKRGVVNAEDALAAIRAAYSAGYVEAYAENPEPILTTALERRDALLARLPVI